MKTDLFQSRGHCWVFQICWHTECSTFRASSFRIWNSSAGIPSPLLALFVVMLPKVHFTSHSRMSGSRWVFTPSLFLSYTSVFIWLFVTPWTVACQAPPPMGFPRQKYWSGWQFSSLGDLLNPGIKSGSPALQVDCLPTEPPGKPTLVYMHIIKYKLKISKKEKHMREL